MRQYQEELDILQIGFNPRTPGGVRQCIGWSCSPSFLFQSTHPGWGATVILLVLHLLVMFQSTHPGWGATKRIGLACKEKWVSIHAPRVGCDMVYDDPERIWFSVSIHAPRVGCDPDSLTRSSHIFGFNPRTPGGVRHVNLCAITVYIPVSIHAPRVGCDQYLLAR